jgi:hypothetical protein
VLTTERVARTVEAAEAAGMRYCFRRRFLVSSFINQKGMMEDGAWVVETWETGRGGGVEADTA